MAYSFIKAIIRNELMFNCYYLHNYHLTTGPYFKMVRKVKADKKPGIREILQSAVAGGHWYSIPKYLGLGKRESEELKFQQAGKWLLKETEGYKENLFQTVTGRPCLPQFPRIKIRIRVERMRKLPWSEDGKGV